MKLEGIIYILMFGAIAWLLYTISVTGNKPMMQTAGEPKQEDCSQWTGEGWNMCIVDQLQAQDAEQDALDK